ncbi:MAG TPA: hypothetical protein VH279_05750 [Solirubrobacteraceae bacterium]|jgi:hypothetical protein|nr:hypothetical protein [Solirubrobacteraceae bacterium]
MPTPHERRVKELEARRSIIADLEALIESSTGTVPAADVVKAFERGIALLPPNSKLEPTFEGLAKRLRNEGAGRIAESGLRQLHGRLRRDAEDVGRVVDARDEKLRAKHG